MPASESPQGQERLRALATVFGVAFVAFLPFLRGTLAGQAFFFRDLSRHFFPIRRFVIEGLLRGEFRYWNPYNHEGIPLPLLPFAYPLEALQAFWPDERGFSLLLALHVPLAAVAFLLLARGLGVGLLGAAGGALAYALGGFSLSTLNLYVYVHALAWAPLLVLTLLRAGSGGPRAVAMAAVVTAISLSTAGVEIVLQAALFGLVLAFAPGDGRRWLRLLGSLTLGAALAAPVLLVLGAITSSTERASGFTADIMLNQSLHPFGLLQVLIGNLYGDLGNIPNRWWGVNFFEHGFPYILSIYLGALVLSLALTGSGRRHPLALRILVLAALGLAVALGRWGLPGLVVEHLPAALRLLRFPSKAFFTVHLALTLLAAFGLHRLASAQPGSWRRYALVSLGVGGMLTLAPAIPWLLPESTRWFVLHFFAPGTSWALGLRTLDEILSDAARGGLLAVLGGVAGLAVLAGRLRPSLGSLLLVGLMAADLLRTGVGLNPIVGMTFYQVNPEVLAAVRSLPGRQRIYTCDPQDSRAYWVGRRARPESHETFTFAVWMNTLSPNFNMPLHIPTALSEDLTSLVALSATPPAGASCGSFEALADRLRSAAVTHVLSLDPVESPDLQLLTVVPPPEIAPASLHVYALRGSLPWRSIESFAEGGSSSEALGYAIQALEADDSGTSIEIETPVPALMVVRDGFAHGWRAWVNGTPTVVRETREHHCAVAVPAGFSRVVLRYQAPGLRSGLVVLLISAFGVAILACWGRRPQAAPGPGGSSSAG